MDTILPSQFFADLGSVGRSGEQRLMLSVLVDAINVLQSWQDGGSAHKRRNFAEAAQMGQYPRNQLAVFIRQRVVVLWKLTQSCCTRACAY
jgi:hypothetical protein